MKLLSTIFVAGVLSSTAAFAAPFKTEELPTAATAAAEAFKGDLGQSLYDAIFGIQVQKSSGGGKAKIFYKEAGVDKTAEFSCHYHGAEIDCH